MKLLCSQGGGYIVQHEEKKKRKKLGRGHYVILVTKRPSDQLITYKAVRQLPHVPLDVYVPLYQAP